MRNRHHDGSNSGRGLPDAPMVSALTRYRGYHRAWPLLVVMAVYASLAVDAVAQDGVATDRAALGALYDATGGETWRNSTNWKTDAPLGEWYGVRTAAAGRVTLLDLGGNALSGPIPEALGSLSNLKRLILYGNALSGPIPESLGNLSNLTYLYLYGNALSGPIPESLGNLSNLTYLYLNGNALSGPIPDALGRLSNLEELYLSGNELTGPIPESLGNLSNLTYLYLNGNALSGPIPESLGSLSNLQYLSLRANELTGPIPEALGSLSNLTYLYLNDNALSGPIPESLGNLSNLTYLYLNDNALSGPIPESLGNLSNLTYLYLNDNALSGPIPESLGNLSNLTLLYLHDNALSGPIPESLGNLSNLTLLYLHDNALSGPIPDALGNLSSLTYLSLNDNALTGPIPESLGNLSSLEYLSLYDNELTGPIPEALGSLSNLKRLILYGNALSGPIPESLGNLSNLTYLYLNGNALSGPIPESLGNLSNLTLLYLGGNALSGPIPDALGRLSNLEELYLSGNELTGPIPESLGNLSNLTLLYLGGNVGVCVPADIAFQEWLATIEDFGGFTCPRGSLSIPNLGGRSITSNGTEADLQEGYGRIRADAGSTTPSGIAIIGYSPGGTLISEAGVPAFEPVREGRIFAEVNGPVNTGLAIANPNDAPATIDFYFTDTEGVRFGEDSFELGAHEQIADFLNETPFNGGDTVLGTFTFTSSLPIAVIALRGLTNRDGEFLMTTLPVAPLATPLTPFTTDTANTGTVYFPHFADGSGWATQVILVNPTVRTITGTVRFLDQGSATAAAAPAVRTLEDGRTGSSFVYSIPPNGSYRIVTSNPSGGVSVGSVRAIPDNGHRAPSGLVVFSYTFGGKTLLEAGVPALPAGSAFRVYVESSGTPEQAGSIRTGVAITNAADAVNTVTLEVTGLDGTLAAPPDTLTLPPSGQVSRFIDEFFDSLPADFSGVLRVTSTAEVAVVGLRLRYNRRSELKMTTTPPSIETGPPTMMDRYFAHIVDSKGWSTQFILFSGTAGQTSSGTLSFIDTAGKPWDLPTESSVSDGSGPPDEQAFPLTWVFAGDVPYFEQALLREEMEYSRAYFADKFGVTARGFTVLVGENYEALSPVFRDVVGRDLSTIYHPEAKTGRAFVISSAHGGAVVTLIYGEQASSFSSHIHAIAHEYFHVLQGQLASGFAQLQNGEFAWDLDTVPVWLVEGFASYADYKYTPSRPGRRPFLGDSGNRRYTPFSDLGGALAAGQLNYDDLARSTEYSNVRCSFGQFYFYALSFSAALFLGEQTEENSYVEFWRLLGERSTWEQAFEEAFGTGVDDFYKEFEEWLPSQIPSFDRVTIKMLWPDMEANPLIQGFVYLNTEGTSWEGNSPTFRVSTGAVLEGHDLYLYAEFAAGTIGRTTFTLWWSDDQITRHLLGWYKDGELTDQRVEATPIEFTGVSYGLEWKLPAHPNTLPRLESRPR